MRKAIMILGFILIVSAGLKMANCRLSFEAQAEDFQTRYVEEINGTFTEDGTGQILVMENGQVTETFKSLKEYTQAREKVAELHKRLAEGYGVEVAGI